MHRLLPLVVTLVGVLAPTAAAAPPDPFGHPCAPYAASAVHCPTATDADRVASFDGTPLDVDVTLPSTGDGPFATIVLLHGFGGSKAAFQSVDPSAGRFAGLNTAHLAQQGYAVVTPSARGFGRSCGAPDSRTAGCEQGFIHLADHRYEVRDVQHLLGLLVDQGVADPRRLGVAGESYGGGQALSLGVLADRIRLPDGSFAPWTSPNGTPLRIAAAAPIIPWSDLAAALVPNGRPASPITPVGVPLESYTDGLYALATNSGFVGADLTAWRARLKRGEPYGRDVQAILTELSRFHSALSVPLGPRPAEVNIASGWNDDLFPVDQALRAYEALRTRTFTELTLGDFGHPRGGNAVATLTERNRTLFNFFFCAIPADGHICTRDAVNVSARLTACAGLRATRYGARTWAGLHPGRLVLRGGTAAGTIRRAAAGTRLEEAFNPIGGAADPCKTERLPRRPRDAFVLDRRSPGVTLLGTPSVRLRVRARGAGGQLVARLWDVDPATRRGRLISRGVYRLRAGQRAAVVLPLHPQGYRFERGRIIRLELRRSDAPYYRRTTRPFSVAVSDVVLELPVRERRR